MDPARKRQIRLVVSLTTAVFLAVGLIYVSFSASTEAKQPSDVIGTTSDQTYELTGTVVPGSIKHDGANLRFDISDRDDPSAKLPVNYSGTVPDPFRDGREVIVTGKVERGTLVAQRDSLITKCPSKFADQAQQDPEHVVITTKS